MGERYEQFCNYYQACADLPPDLTPPPLRPSMSVRDATAALLEDDRLLGPSFDAVHLRQSDKAETETRGSKLAVPALSARRLAQHLLATLPPPDDVGSAAGRRRRLYIATDTPALASMAEVLVESHVRGMFGD